MLNLFKAKGSKEEIFWQWVTKNLKKIKAIKTGHDPIYQKANQKIKEYNKELVFEVCGDDIIISADGSKQYFDDVIKLCEASPKTDKFNVIPFRPAQGFFSLNYNGVEVSHEDVFMEYEKHNDQIDLKIYHKDYSEENKNNIGGAIFIILDHGIGEYNVEMKLRYIDFHTLTDQQNLTPIAELKKIIENQV